MIVADLAAYVPTGGVAGLVAVLMALQYRSNSDQRRNEIDMRTEFTKERTRMRVECAEERDRDRREIEQLQAVVDRLRERVDRLMGLK